jgi:AcrR family transcriptional regulator
MTFLLVFLFFDAFFFDYLLLFNLLSNKNCNFVINTNEYFIMENLTPRQREIFDVALELFNINGYGKTSMRDIAKVMDVKASSLYAHITSKEEILEWMSRDVRARFMDRFDEILISNNSAEEKFNLVLQNHIKSIFENVKLYDVFMTNVYRLKVDFKNQNMYLTKIDKYIEDIHKTIKDCYVSLGITDPEKLLFSTKYTITVMNNLHRYIYDSKLSLDVITEMLKKTILYGVVCNK